MENQSPHKPIPYASLSGAIGFVVCLLVLAILESMHASDSSLAAQKTRVMNVMVCVLLASWSSIVSLITAWCPIILGGDRRPLFWVVPLVLGWILFAQIYDWTSLLPH